MEVIKYLYRCKCGHGFYKNSKRLRIRRNYKCGVCGSRKTKFIRSILKAKREKRKILWR